MSKRCNGFSLIELIVIMVIMGILSAYASSRINFTSHSAAGCVETVKASIRMAQKLAIAQRSAVTVNVGDACEVTVGGENYPALTGVNVAYSGGVSNPEDLTNPGNVTFNGLGQPFLDVAAPMLSVPMTSVRIFTISGGDVVRYVCLEPETGYVHQGVENCV
ncbi:type II secretion system protein [Methylobacter sp. Wu8]|uniref:pilus assembly FimT family protein n=1 Tax=Methylobacter sp. Wu8 TaxID=3118457 RepID=UPI002F2D03D7